MNYNFTEKFNIANDNGMPYSLTEENIHPYTKAPGRIENNRFLIIREGAKILLKTPSLTEFDYVCKLGFKAPAQAFRKHISWGIYFGYTPSTRSGNLFKISYYENEQTLWFSLLKTDGRHHTVAAETIVQNINLEPDTMYDFSLTVKNGNCNAEFNGIRCSFPCEVSSGKIGFSNQVSIQGLLISDINISSDIADGQIISENRYIIPHYDGGSENYILDVKVNKLDDIYEIEYSLTGGAFSRKTKDYKMGIWSVQYDFIENPYIRFYSNNNSEKLYLKNGTLRFVEQNETFTATDKILCGEKMPYCGKFQLEKFDENSDFAFGYDLFRRLGNELQEDRREFVYENTVLVYSGASLSDDYIITAESPEDKKITTLIPKDIDEYENALAHAAGNHYFMYDEDVCFTIHTHTKKFPEFATYKFYLLDAFFNEIKEINPVTEESEKFTKYGLYSLKHKINLGKMSQGVYHIKTAICINEDEIFTQESAFEVFDNSNISPKESSGIPFMYSGEAAPANIKYNCPDPWIIKPDHNEIHYLDCMLAVPEITENRKGWEILKLYKRKMFLWIDSRTVPSGKSYKDYPKSLPHADFLNVTATNAGIINYNIFPSIFKNPLIAQDFKNFNAMHPDYNMPEIKDGTVSQSDFNKYYNEHGMEWLEYLCNKNTDRFLEFKNEIKKLNPDIKFSKYGPYAIYGTRHSGIISSKLRMVPYERAHEIMDGFWIFEDYPFITAQHTHYSAWNMLGILMHMSKANVVVELFGSFDPVCPDGFVFHAFPPMGGIYVESYRTVTQIYEHLYAAVYKNGAFHYYNNPKFQFLQSYNTEAKKRFAELLKGYGVYLNNKPEKPERSAVFVQEYTNDDVRFGFDFYDRDANNISQAGLSYIYETLAEAGIPKGFATDFDGITDLDEAKIDLLVLPSLKYAPENVKEKIRQLSEKGISLVAVSDISDLTDIFGVKKQPVKKEVCLLKNDDENEIITKREAEFLYKEETAEVILYAVTTDGETLPFILKYNNNVIINSYICRVGCSEYVHDGFGISNVGKLIKKTVTKLLKDLSKPLAVADNNCGINIFKNEKNEKMILLTDYTVCGNKEKKEITVKLNFDVDNVKCVCHKDMTITPKLIKVNGKIKAFTVTLRPGESGLFKVE